MCKLKGRYYQLYPSLSTHCHRSFLLNVFRFILTIIQPYCRSTIPTVRRFLVFVVTKTENDHRRLQTTRNHQETTTHNQQTTSKPPQTTKKRPQTTTNDHKPPRNDHKPPANDQKSPGNHHNKNQTKQNFS